MALITCQDCGNQVSSRAANCPKCGAPVSGGSIGDAIGKTVTTEHRTVTIEQTSKSIKLMILVSGLSVVVGMIATVVSLDEPEHAAGWLVFTVVAFIAYVGAKAARWWVNG